MRRFFIYFYIQILYAKTLITNKATMIKNHSGFIYIIILILLLRFQVEQ